MRSPLLLRKKDGVNKPLQSIAQHESDGKEVSHKVKIDRISKQVRSET